MVTKTENPNAKQNLEAAIEFLCAQYMSVSGTDFADRAAKLDSIVFKVKYDALYVATSTILSPADEKTIPLSLKGRVSKKGEALLAHSLATLLPARTANVLLKKGYMHLADIAHLSFDNLTAIEGVGEKSITKLRAELKAKGVDIFWTEEEEIAEDDRKENELFDFKK